MKSIKYINIFFLFTILFSSFINVNAQEVKTINDFISIDVDGKVIYTSPINSSKTTINTIEDLKKIIQTKTDVAVELEDAPPFSNEVKTKTKDSNLLDAKKIISLINEERQSRNLSYLEEDSILTTTAEDHCVDMMNNNYFSHNDKNGNNPKTRAVANGSKSSLITEIIYWTNTKTIDVNKSSIEAQNWWMNDRPHMLNIVNKSFKKIGGSICKGSVLTGYKNYFVVMFSN